MSDIQSKRAEAWIRFGAAALASDDSVQHAAKNADDMLKEFDKRFDDPDNYGDDDFAD